MSHRVPRYTRRKIGLQTVDGRELEKERERERDFKQPRQLIMLNYTSYTLSIAEGERERERANTCPIKCDSCLLAVFGEEIGKLHTCRSKNKEQKNFSMLNLLMIERVFMFICEQLAENIFVYI